MRDDFWKALHAKRTRNKSTTVTPRKKVGTPARAPLGAPPIARKAAAPPPARAPRGPRQDFDDWPAPIEPAKQQRPDKRRRFLVHVDMVNPENQALVKAAAEAEGRPLSQWARLVLLKAARGN
ncbi:hypothetical protein CMI37_07580 [Candidatus Pacearchaeota archaeon]|nr:hypothetical protein [Candidatus Pacearchaeota archaeon]